MVNCNDQKKSIILEQTFCSCGIRTMWLGRDKFGVYWQIMPENMAELMGKNPDKTTPAMLNMKKIIIADLIQAGKKNKNKTVNKHATK